MYGNDDIPDFEKAYFERPVEAKNNNDPSEWDTMAEMPEKSYSEMLEAETNEEENNFSEQIDGAAGLLKYGLDSASIGLGENGTQIVINKIKDVDSSDPKAFESFYQNLDMNEDTLENISHDLREMREANTKSSSVSFHEDFQNALKNMKDVIDEVEHGSNFSEVQEGARENGMDVVSYLLKDEKNPSLSKFLAKARESENKVKNEEPEEIKSEDVEKLEEIEEEKEELKEEIVSEEIPSEETQEKVEEVEKLENEVEKFLVENNLEEKDIAEIIEDSNKELLV